MPEVGTRVIQVTLFLMTASASAINGINSRSQNSIMPRNSSTGIVSGGETCVLSNTNSLSRSPCRIPCEKDDDCINHGRHRCCPTLPGSSCIGECLVMDQKSVRRTKTCIEVRSRKRYDVGETFVREDKCCTCLVGGIHCASTVKTCQLGCKKNSKYFRHGEAIPSRSCHNCSCHNGSVICSSDVKCIQGKCSYRGKSYGQGELLRLHRGCKECVCRASRWNCIALTCNAAKSDADFRGAYSHVGFLSLIIIYSTLRFILVAKDVCTKC
ncbi:hypothetical protein OS493_020683 [Desmophyllum pertusum]|uniref:Uncharacterized protein n=1 Tax=Desmophyllum pertusum TaxID=174260 RepID=A0A9W9YMP7_9CNID|nr:hypothetical protein OS493_020683 [Desmophyllum pertusum]